MTIEKDGEYVVSGSKQFPTGDALFVPVGSLGYVLSEKHLHPQKVITQDESK